MASPKYLGFDCELSTFGNAADGAPLAPLDAARRVLEHIDAAFAPHGTACWKESAGAGSASAWSTDSHRAWAPNGQCYYIDLAHVEVCGAETLSPRRYAAERIAALRVVEAARASAEAADPGVRLALGAANVDASDPSVSWGTHTDVCVETALWEDLFHAPRRPAVLGFVASAMAALAPFFGAGYLLPTREGVVFSSSARAHHLTEIVTLPTTQAWRRGLLNSRREGHGAGHERMHLISTDYCLAGALLQGSLLQCVLAAAEEGFCGLNLYDPVQALRAWSLGLDLERGSLPATARLVDGRSLTLPAYVRELCTALLAMVRAELVDERVAPGAEESLLRVVELTHALERGGSSLASAARHLDWVAKLLYLTDLCARRGIALDHPAARLADHDFTSTDPRRGAFWRLWEAGLVDPLVTAAEVDACLRDGPPETRAFARGRIVQRFASSIASLDWSEIELRRTRDRWAPRVRLSMPRLDALGAGRFERSAAPAVDVDELERLLRDSHEVRVERVDPYFDGGVAWSTRHDHENGGR